MRSRPLAAILLTLAFSAAACQFIWSYDNFKDQPGTTGSVASGATSSSSGGGASSSGGGSTSTSTTSSSSGCTIDDDKDQFYSWKCNPSNPNDPTLDCADEDPRAFPDAGFATSPITGVTRPGLDSWDFNCNGSEEQQTPVCGNTYCNGMGFAPGTMPICGTSYQLGSCFFTFFGCGWSAVSPPTFVEQGCK